MAQFGFTFDALMCVGCHACAVACKAEMNTPEGVRYRRVVYRELGVFGGTGANAVRRQMTSMSCFHCANPACVLACPTGAMAKDPDLGIVRVDQNVCVGCRRCEASCPYGAAQFNVETSKMEKCSACWHRIVDTTTTPPTVKAGVRPACVVTCPGRALSFTVKDTWGSGTAPDRFFDPTLTEPSVDFG